MKKTLILTLMIAVLFVLSGATSFSADAVAPAGAPPVFAPGQTAPAQTVAEGAPAAAASGTQAAATQQPSVFGMLPFMLVMFGVMYFLMIRPQQKRMKEHQSLISGLKNGDEVVTSAGIIGTIAGMSEKVVTLEVSKNVQLKVLKSQVNQVVKGQIKDIQMNA
jgi:preprotein translocase subunit YajC